MGQPIDFDGSNVVMRAPEGAENVQDMHVYRTRHSCVSCWTFTPEELAEINQTGRVFLSVLAAGQQPPVYVGSESTCREVMVDFGPVWPMAPRQSPARDMEPWTPPPEGERPEGFECLAFIPVRWQPSFEHPARFEWGPSRYGMTIEGMAKGWAPLTANPLPRSRMEAGDE